VVAYQLSGHRQGEANEHVFYDLPTVEKVAGTIAQRLGEIAPRQSKTFERNAARFVDGVHKLEHKAQRIGREHPGTGAVATEPVADYLLQTAGVRNATPGEFAEAVEHDVDIPAKALADTKALITGKKVGLLLNNVQTETQSTTALSAAAKSSGIPVVGMTETFPAGTTSYLAWMGKAVDDLAAAMNGQQQ
jgi:zinc/manganese transport system substrate-binding protein